MLVYSLRREGFELKPIIVEVTLVPGLPGIQILGLPDQVIRESAIRLRSALRKLGLPFPKSHQVVVNLRPSHIRKKSLGIEFAIAAALLWEMEVFEKPDHIPILYGEVNLEGGVEAPEDLQDLLELPPQSAVWTGVSSSSLGKPFQFWTDHYQVETLNDLGVPQMHSPTSQPLCLDGEKDLDQLQFSPSNARLLAIIATGEHPTLFAGAQGLGKTTMAQVVHRLLPPVEDKTFRKIQAIHRLDGCAIERRPMISPHHTASCMAVIGGGSAAKPGDVTRAHGGVLLLDEYLQFQTNVQEALREPFEAGSVRVSKNGRSIVYPARSLVLATTNLCPCGRWTPGEPTRCSLSMRRCRGHLERLSGPMIDRFSIVHFAKRTHEVDEVEVKEVRETVTRAREYSKARGQRFANHYLGSRHLLEMVKPIVREHLMPKESHRRMLSLLRVSRTIADLEGQEEITEVHIAEAEGLATLPIHRLMETGF